MLWGFSRVLFRFDQRHSFAVDHGHAVPATGRDVNAFTVGRNGHAFWFQLCLAFDARQFDCLHDRVIFRIDDRDDVSVFGADVRSRTVRGEDCFAWTCADEELLHDLARAGVDDAHAAAALGGDVDPTSIGADRGAFGFEADRHAGNHAIRFDVGDRGGARVFVGDVEARGVVVDGEVLGIGAGFVLGEDVAVAIELGDLVFALRLVAGITDRHPDLLFVRAEANATQTSTDFDG